MELCANVYSSFAILFEVLLFYYALCRFNFEEFFPVIYIMSILLCVFKFWFFSFCYVGEI